MYETRVAKSAATIKDVPTPPGVVGDPEPTVDTRHPRRAMARLYLDRNSRMTRPCRDNVEAGDIPRERSRHYSQATELGANQELPDLPGQPILKPRGHRLILFFRRVEGALGSAVEGEASRSSNLERNRSRMPDHFAGGRIANRARANSEIQVGILGRPVSGTLASPPA